MNGFKGGERKQLRELARCLREQARELKEIETLLKGWRRSGTSRKSLGLTLAGQQKMQVPLPLSARAILQAGQSLTYWSTCGLN